MKVHTAVLSVYASIHAQSSTDSIHIPYWYLLVHNQVTVIYHGNILLDTMTDWKVVKIPAPLADIIDRLVDSGRYSSRAEYVRETIRNDLRERDILGARP